MSKLGEDPFSLLGINDDDDDDDIIPLTSSNKKNVSSKLLPDKNNPLSFFRYSKEDNEHISSDNKNEKKSSTLINFDDFDDLDDDLDDIDDFADELPSSLNGNEQLKRKIDELTQEVSNYQILLKKSNQTIEKLKEKEKKESLELEKAIALVEKNLKTQIERAEKAEKLNQQLKNELISSNQKVVEQQKIIQQLESRIQELSMKQNNTIHEDVTWQKVKNRNSQVIQFLKNFSEEARTVHNIILKNAKNFNELYRILEDIENIVDIKENQKDM